MTLRMGDSTDPTALPPGLDAYAGYVGGRWPDFEAIATREGSAHLLSIAIAADEDADCLDIERGDATVDQAPQWAHRQRLRGMWRPALYISVSSAQALVDLMTAGNATRRSFRLFTAHYDPQRGAHICGPGCYPGFRDQADGTQWVDHGGWDESLLADDFFAAFAQTPPAAPRAGRRGVKGMIVSDGTTEWLVNWPELTLKHRIPNPTAGSAYAGQLGLNGDQVPLDPELIGKLTEV